MPLVATGGGCGSSAPKIEIINHNLVIIGLQVNPWPGNICCFSSKILKISSTSEFGIIELFFLFSLRLQECLDYLPLQVIFNRSVCFLAGLIQRHRTMSLILQNLLESEDSAAERESEFKGR